MQLQGLCPTAGSVSPRTGKVLPALQRRPAGWSPRFLPGFPPGPCLAALLMVLIHLHHVRLQLSSAGRLLTVLESGPSAPLPPARLWTRSRMADGVNPGGAHAVGPQPRHLAQVVLWSIRQKICRIRLLPQQCCFKVSDGPTAPSKASHDWTCMLA